MVLNLVINGLPSILLDVPIEQWAYVESFKPCYKWITFNIVWKKYYNTYAGAGSFKPCYKWITFNIFERGLLVAMYRRTF